MTVQTPTGPVLLGSILNYQIGNAITQVQREDGDLTISVDSEVRDGYNA